MATFKKLLKNRNGDIIIPVTDADTFSTTEKKVGVWVDGKTIYRKTISCGSLANATKKTVAHSISNFGSLIKAEMRWYDTADSRWFSNLRYDSSTIFVNFDGCNATNLYINCQGTNWSTRTNNCYVTLYYTKTTG